MKATFVWDDISQRASFDFLEELVSRLEQRLPDTLILNPILPTDPLDVFLHNVATVVSRSPAKSIIMTAWFEPPWAAYQDRIIDLILSSTDKPWMRLGYGLGHSRDVFFDFWAVCFNALKPQYSKQDILPVAEPDKLYLNQNRSPAKHKTELFNLLEAQSLLDAGYVSYGNRLIDETVDYYSAEKSLGVLTDIPNDPYTLGNLGVWKNHVLTVVSDSMPPGKKRYGNIVLSEKFYKPIVGLRPFLVNGNPDNLRFLKQQGFDVFEDVFDFDADNYDQHRVIVAALQKLKALTPKQRREWYDSLLPRLEANKQHFDEYVSKQYEILDTVVVNG